MVARVDSYETCRYCSFDFHNIFGGDDNMVRPGEVTDTKSPTTSAVSERVGAQSFSLIGNKK